MSKFKATEVYKINESVKSFYTDVNLHSDSGSIKAHKLVLASNSKWFHDKFKDSQSTERCDIYLFNTHHHVLRAFVNVLYGEETLFPSKDQKRLIFLLSKFGVKWEYVVDKKVDSAKDILKRPDTESKDDADNVELSSIIPPYVPKTGAEETGSTLEDHGEVKDVTADKPSTHDASSHKVQINDDYYEVLDEFTEADDGELEKINHVKMVICGSNQHKYKCTKCGMLWRFFSQAEHHHIEHEFTKTKHIREVLKDAELERTKDLKSLKKIEKIAGTAKASKALQTLDRITSNLRTRLDAVNTVKQQEMPENLREKCHEFVNLLEQTSKKANELKIKILDS